jgi:hypothetical protein
LALLFWNLLEAVIRNLEHAKSNQTMHHAQISTPNLLAVAVIGSSYAWPGPTYSLFESSFITRSE